MNFSTAKNNRTRFLPFFSSWFFIGLIILLLGVILESNNEKIGDEYKYWYAIAYDLLKNIGIAVLISNVFSHVIGTQQFIDFIRDKLINIIVSKDFIQKLNKDERRDMLHVILRPTKELSQIYSGINRYFNTYITDSLKLFNSHYRSSYNINAEAMIDKDKNVVYVEADLNYRIYKVLGEYEKLPIGFEDEESKVIFTKVTAPGGLEEIIENVDLKKKEDIENEELLKNDPSILTGSTVQIPDSFKEFSQLDVSRRVIEYGNDHWHLMTYRSL